MLLFKKIYTQATLALCIVLMLHIVCAAQNTPAQNNFAVKGFHLDMRIQVMTMPALKKFVQQLHSNGINTLIMEYEANYPYQKHALIPGRYAYTQEEIKSFITYCNGLGVDVIPLQQSFGHVEYILRHYRYAALREDEDDLSQVCPSETEKDSLMFTDLFTELAATHTSQYIHIGCDETHLLGHCAKCSKKVAEEGVSKLYIDYVKMLCNIVIKLGKRPVLWADIALKYPEALQELPKQTVLVDWNYGWDLSHFGEHAKLMQSGLEIWGAPALRSHPDNYFITQWQKHFNNIHDFVPACRQMGYKGMVMTSWSTSGEYSRVDEASNSLLDLYAVRHVYPVTGFNILLAAYAQSIAQTNPLDIESFVIKYCAEHYGFTATQAQLFWQALKAAPYEVKNGKVASAQPITLAALVDSVAWVLNTFNTLQPLQNKEEFEHYRLRTSIRLQYLRFSLIEKEVNSDSFNSIGVPDAIKQLQVLIANSATLDKKFIALNKDSYNPAELEEENNLRNAKLLLLYKRLAKER